MKAVLRPLPGPVSGRMTLTVCVNDRGPNAIAPSCGSSGSPAIEAALRAAVAARALDVDIQTIRCLGLCEKGPNVRLAPGNNWFHEVSADDAGDLLDQALAHVAAG